MVTAQLNLALGKEMIYMQYYTFIRTYQVPAQSRYEARITFSRALENNTLLKDKAIGKSSYNGWKIR